MKKTAEYIFYANQAAAEEHALMLENEMVGDENEIVVDAEDEGLDIQIESTCQIMRLIGLWIRTIRWF